MNITKNTISNKWAKKALGLVLTLVIASTIGVNSAQALTLSDVELLINLGIIPAEKAAVARAAVSGTPSNTSCGVFTRNLTLGSTGSDVVSLQSFLEAKNFMTIPVGVSKGYFGGLTQSALARYQASVGITPAAGYFGPITRTQVQNSCTSNPNNPTPSNPELGRGEASLEDYDSTSAYSNEDLEEGDESKVFAAEFTVEDGDIKIQRVDVRVEAVDESKEDEPWKQIDEITLFANGKKVASENVDSNSDWSRQDSTDGSVSNTRSYEMRFTNLDLIFREGDDVELEIEVKVSDNIDDSDLTQSWKIWIPTEGIRGVDGEGINQYTGSDSESKTFSIEVADSGDLSIRESDDDLDSTILIVDNDNKKGPYEVFRFEIDNDDSADILVNTLTILATSSVEASNIDNVISKLTIEIDGDEFDFDSKSITNGTNAYLFDLEDNGDEFTIEKGEVVEVVVKVEFNKLSGNYTDGTTVQFGIGKVNGENFDIGLTAEGESTGDDSDVSGRQEGSEHTLRTSGVVISGDTTSATVKKAQFLGDTEKGIFEIEITVDALEEDAYISKGVATSASSGAGFVFRVTNTGTEFTGNTVSFVSEDTAKSIVDNRYKISEGTSATFTIRVELDPTGSSAGNAYGIELNTVRFASTSDGTLVDYTIPNETEFETKKVTID